jgi:phosphoglycolate phosphatase-like HAD superfamily hydrolase
MRDEKMQVETILFDLDGTILNIVDRDAFARYKALNQLDRVSLDEVKRHYRYGIGRMGIVKKLGIELTEKQEEEYIKASFAHFAKRENVMRLTKSIIEHTMCSLFFPKKYKLVLVTSRDSLSSTEEELELFNIREFFDFVITREVAAKSHKAREIPLLPFHEQRTKLYECAIGLTKTDPKNMLCIGDSVGELEPAKKLGMKAIGVLTGFSSKEDMENTSISTIQDLTQLIEILDCLNNTLS